MDSKNKEISDEWIGDHIKTKNKTYIPINKLGSGSFATVYMAYDVQTRKLVAIKIFNEDDQKNGAKEIEILKNIKSLKIRNCITYLDSFTDEDGDLYCVTDLAIGSLYDIYSKGGIQTKNNKFRLKKFSVDFVLKVTKNILESISDLHDHNLIHGDIKPDNILIIARNKFHKEIQKKLNGKKINKITKIIKEFNANMDYESDSDSDSDAESNISEFSGLSREQLRIDLDSDSDMDSDIESVSDAEADSEDEKSDLDDEVLSRLLLDEDKYLNPTVKLCDLGNIIKDDDNKPKGIQTKYYKSPELLLGLGYDKSSDIWALGCTIYELLTGNILFDPDTIIYDYNLDSRRTIIQLIDFYVEKIPDDYKNQSPYKDAFFDSELNFKSHFYNEIDSDLNKEDNTIMDKWIDLFKLTNDERIFDIYNLLMMMLNIDKEKRISAKDCLKNDLFNTI
jgi:serine/threonine protein kinase